MHYVPRRKKGACLCKKRLELNPSALVATLSMVAAFKEYLHGPSSGLEHVDDLPLPNRKC